MLKLHFMKSFKSRIKHDEIEIMLISFLEGLK